MSDQQEAGYGLVLSFTGLDFGNNPEHAFVHGVEFGQLWQRMRSGTEAEIEGTFAVANLDIIFRAASAEGWLAEVSPHCQAWCFVKMKKIAKAKANPHGLRVVQ